MMFAPPMEDRAIRARHVARRSGFTLIEVLVTLLVLSIALPPIMQGIQLATKAASQAKRRDEAANLASSKISQLIADQTWQTNGASAGDFAPDWPDYRWQSSVANWAQDTSTMGLEELDVTVSWTQNSRAQSIVVSTLVFPRNSTQ